MNYRGGFNGGFGGANLGQLMKQAQKMQADMERAKAELQAQEFESVVGGGMVRVVMMGNRTVKAIEIKPEIIDPDDKEMLEDLILAGVNDALAWQGLKCRLVVNRKLKTSELQKQDIEKLKSLGLEIKVEKGEKK